MLKRKLLGEVRERLAQLAAFHHRPGHQLPTFYEGLHLVGENAKGPVRVQLIQGSPPVPCLSDGLQRLGRLREGLTLPLGPQTIHAVKETIAARGVEVVAGAILQYEARQVLPRTTLKALYRASKRHHPLPRSRTRLSASSHTSPWCSRALESLRVCLQALCACRPGSARHGLPSGLQTHPGCRG